MVTKASTRYGFIDAIRGVAACLVMVQHSLYQSGFLGNYPDEKLTGFVPTYLEMGMTGVVAFFLVSGFVIPLSLEKTNNFKLFWLHRALRILPLYLVIYVVTLILLGGGGLRSSIDFLVNAISHLFFIQEYVRQENFVGGSWTLSLELVWYIGISTMFLLGLNRKTGWLVGLSVAVSVLAQIACAMGIDVPMGRLSMLVCCVLGLVCYRFDKSDISSHTFLILAGALVAAIILNLLAGFLLFRNSSVGFASVANSWLLGGLVFIVPFFTRSNPIWDHAVFAFLGRISYSVYLVHAVALILAKHAQLEGWFLLAFVFSATIGVATLTHRFIETPPILFGHGLTKRTKPATVATNQT